MKILIAPDKFKGSLSAREVAERIATGIRDVFPEAEIEVVPMADGGEGTAEVICDALSGSLVTCKAHDPVGREIEARYVWTDERKLAVMEVSEAAGMKRLEPNELDADRTNTSGVGEMILDATKRGAREIIIGLGGSATNDGGVGMARALGFQFLIDESSYKLDRLNRSSSRGREPQEQQVGEAVGELAELVRIERPAELSLPRIVAVSDVRNPLLGENGATRVFGPQKGATPDEVGKLDKALTRLADVVARDLGVDFRDQSGAGAAGGLGFGLMSFCSATIEPGFDYVADLAGLEAKTKDVDLVITGEGRLDRQTLEGKVPAGVARIARKFGKRVYAIVGQAENDAEVRQIFDGVYELGGSIAEARQLLRKKAAELARNLSAAALQGDK